MIRRSHQMHQVHEAAQPMTPGFCHHKRRLLNEAFVALLATRLKSGGMLRTATDWEHYATAMLEVLNGCALLENTATDGGYVPRPQARQPTRFERRGERLGHGVRDLAVEDLLQRGHADRGEHRVEVLGGDGGVATQPVKQPSQTAWPCRRRRRAAPRAPRDRTGAP